jgi:transcriptional regulator with XRE-family HTH domain
MPSFEAVIAKNVCAERARRRWRQQDLADVLDWSVSQVSGLERAKRRILAGELVALCRAFQIGLEELARGADPADLNDLRIA